MRRDYGGRSPKTAEALNRVATTPPTWVKPQAALSANTIHQKY